MAESDYSINVLQGQREQKMFLQEHLRWADHIYGNVIFLA